MFIRYLTVDSDFVKDFLSSIKLLSLFLTDKKENKVRISGVHHIDYMKYTKRF